MRSENQRGTDPGDLGTAAGRTLAVTLCERSQGRAWRGEAARSDWAFMGSLAMWGRRPWGGPGRSREPGGRACERRRNAPEACSLRRDCGLTDQGQGHQPHQRERQRTGSCSLSQDRCGHRGDLSIRSCAEVPVYHAMVADVKS